MIGMPDVCERKAEKEGAVMCARDECFFRWAWGLLLLGCELEELEAEEDQLEWE